MEGTRSGHSCVRFWPWGLDLYLRGEAFDGSEGERLEGILSETEFTVLEGILAFSLLDQLLRLRVRWGLSRQEDAPGARGSNERSSVREALGSVDLFQPQIPRTMYSGVYLGVSVIKEEAELWRFS